MQNIYKFYNQEIRYLKFKKSFNGCNSRLKMTVERVSEIENRSTEIIQHEDQKEITLKT